MEGEFKLTIILGNEAMSNLEDVARALEKLSNDGLVNYNKIIRDDNGNTVGRYSTVIHYGAV
jgi:transcription initiation factor IIE alpha subunit